MSNVFPVCVAAICLLLAQTARAGAGAVFLRDPSEPQQKREGVLLFIHADGRIFSDSGATNEKTLKETFRQWRAEGTEPAIRLVLFPALKSNSNLKQVRGIIDFLRTHRVAYDIMIESVDAAPDKALQ